MNWNPVLNKIIEVKRAWGKLPCTDMFRETPTFLKMLDELNREDFNEVFDCLQINQKGDFILIRYGLAEMQSGMWNDPNSIYRECRSTVIDIENECVVIAPFRKFFNINEIKENTLENIERAIRNAKVVEFADKLDGSFQCVRFYKGEFILTGSMAIDPEKSWRVKAGYSMLTNNHKRMIKENKCITFMFEFIHPKDAHVVKYTEDKTGLHLIGMRDSMSGYEYYYSDVVNIGSKYGVKTVRIENINLNDVLDRSKTEISSDKEGWVLNVDGYRVKIKCDDYVDLHRLLDKLSSVNTVIKNVAEDRVDDMMSKLPDSHKPRIEKLVKVFEDYVVEKELTIQRYFDLSPKDISRKGFMIWVDTRVPEEYRGYVRNKYLNKPYNLLKNGGLGYKLVSELGLEEKIEEVLNNG